jgi:uncharacterized C2H2 Zn-finger protein
MENEEIFLTKKNECFYCPKCDFNCSYESDWKRHVETKKHKYRVSGNIFPQNGNQKNEDFNCFCGKKYTSQSGLWKHKKSCAKKLPEKSFEEKMIENDFKITPQMFYDLLKQNNELQQAIINLSKDKSPNIANICGNNNNNNNNNKTFNLQFFLNETCKDAINLSDFIDQIQISISDLEETGKLGYAEGISKVFIKNLNDVVYTERPIHCSDSKRETLYIKDNNKWIKDDQNKTALTKAIKHVANKNIKQISEWQKLHPDFSDPDSKTNDKYMQIVLNSMSGSTKEECEKNYEKIVKNVIKEIIIEK